MVSSCTHHEQPFSKTEKQIYGRQLSDVSITGIWKNEKIKNVRSRSLKTWYK